MRLEDWREYPPHRLTPLFDAQRARWRRELSWDARTLFSLIEDARGSGHLPGLVAVDDDGAVAGWCYASVQDGLLFIGALQGVRAEVVRTLLDTVLAAPEASCVRAYRCFLFPDSPAVGAALTRRRFNIQPFHYLTRPIVETTQASLTMRLWRSDDLPDCARLLARAYAGAPDAKCFAPTGRLDEWAGYLAQLVRTPACGTWAPDESFTVHDGDGRLCAFALATRVADDTTHVAQIAVDPQMRRRGIAAALLNRSASAAALAGATRQTLLVADENRAARRLYESQGFERSTQFLYAERARISRVASGTGLKTGTDD